MNKSFISILIFFIIISFEQNILGNDEQYNKYTNKKDKDIIYKHAKGVISSNSLAKNIGCSYIIFKNKTGIYIDIYPDSNINIPFNKNKNKYTTVKIKIPSNEIITFTNINVEDNRLLFLNDNLKKINSILNQKGTYKINFKYKIDKTIFNFTLTFYI